MAQLPKCGLARDNDKSIHRTCAIYFPGGVFEFFKSLVEAEKGQKINNYSRFHLLHAGGDILLVLTPFFGWNPVFFYQPQVSINVTKVSNTTHSF